MDSDESSLQPLKNWGSVEASCCSGVHHTVHLCILSESGNLIYKYCVLLLISESHNWSSGLSLSSVHSIPVYTSLLVSQLKGQVM